MTYHDAVTNILEAFHLKDRDILIRKLRQGRELFDDDFVYKGKEYYWHGVLKEILNARKNVSRLRELLAKYADRYIKRNPVKDKAVCKKCGSYDALYAKKMCKPCYFVDYKERLHVECKECGEIKKHYAHGKCHRCYQREWRGSK